MEWQPIKTAPKDGTIIVGYSDKIGLVLTACLTFDCKDGKWYSSWEDLEGNIIKGKLTHWVHIPPFPGEENE